MTDEQLSEIKARCDAATPEPWAYDGMHDEITTPNRDGDYWLIFSECRTAPNDAPMDNFGHQFSPDFDFIAHARADVPALLAEIARLREALEFVV